MKRFVTFVGGFTAGFITACVLASSGRGSESVPGGAVTDPASGVGPRPLSDVLKECSANERDRRSGVQVTQHINPPEGAASLAHFFREAANDPRFR